jgi:uncharacterized protein (DUF362 family)
MSIVDGILAGEGNGPMAPDLKPAGLLAAGFNPAAVDWVCARLMGFDPDRIPHIRESFRQQDLPVATFGPEEIELSSNDPRISIEPLLERAGRFFAFEPHFGWKGHIEASEANSVFRIPYSETADTPYEIRTTHYEEAR